MKNEKLSFALKVLITFSIISLIPGTYLIFGISVAFLLAPFSFIQPMWLQVVIQTILGCSIFLLGVYIYLSSDQPIAKVNSLILFLISTPIPFVFVLQFLPEKNAFENLYFIPFLIYAIIMGLLFHLLDLNRLRFK
ncbi:MAG: hypothetical protein NXI08_02250 [bacterium]|nr:hypothetical protein [bacterium]